MRITGDATRREVLRNALLLAGLAAVPSACSRSGEAVFSLSENERSLLSAVADTIVPRGEGVGATDAGVPQSLEAMLRDWASDETREEIMSALAVIDRLDAGGFASADPRRRFELLEAHDRTSIGEEEPAEEDRWYIALKGMVVGLFYHSEAALGQELLWEHDPGGFTPSIPLTPETRAQFGRM